MGYMDIRTYMHHTYVTLSHNVWADQISHQKDTCNCNNVSYVRIIYT